MSATLTDRLEAFFRSRPNVWIDGMQLSKVAGQYAWRSRCSDLRKRGMTIENRQRRITKFLVAENVWESYVKSEYRFVAPQPSLLAQMEQPSA